MTSKQFRAAIKKLKMQQKELASLLGIGERTVRNHLGGKYVTNEPTAILVALLADRRITVEDIRRITKRG